MKTKLIISANGKDQKGIVSDISSIITNYNGNIEKWAVECLWWGRRNESFFNK